MKKTIKFILSAAILFTVVVSGQQDPQYTQYMYNQNVYNPAYAGTSGALSIGLLGRTQWVGIEGAPDTQSLFVTSDLGQERGLGLGLSVIHDEIGPIEESNLYLDVAYAFQVGDNTDLSFGIKGGYTFLNNLFYTRTHEDVGYLVDENDILYSLDYKTNYPNIGAGVYLHSNRFYAGVSVPQFLQHFQYDYNSTEFNSDISDKIHIFGTMGYVFDLSESVKLKPSMMMKFVKGSPVSFDLNSSIFLNDKFEFGLSWREGDSIDAIIGVQATDALRVGYAYDYTLTPLGNYNSGSHELMLLFDLNFSKKHIKSPRYF